MSRIAIIDTAIDAKYIGSKAVEYYNLCGTAEIHGNKDLSHGTVCAMVLDYCAFDYELVNIRIFESDKRKMYGEIEVLAKALRLCRELKIDIISLSAVSSILSDSKHLYDITRELAKDMVIVSALDNMGYITVPTSFPHVLGVRSDMAGALLPSELAYRADDPFGTDIYANCDFDFLQEIHRRPSNSFAVPVAAAYINKLLNQRTLKKDIHTLIRDLRRYPTQKGNDGLFYSEQLVQNALPIVVVANCTAEMCRLVMDTFYEKYEVQSAALSLSEVPYDVRVRTIKNIRDINEALLFMKLHYKTNMIFIFARENQFGEIRKTVEVDVEVIYLNNGVIIRHENGCESIPHAIALERLNEILTV